MRSSESCTHFSTMSISLITTKISLWISLFCFSSTVNFCAPLYILYLYYIMKKNSSVPRVESLNSTKMIQSKRKSSQNADQESQDNIKFDSSYNRFTKYSQVHSAS